MKLKKDENGNIIIPEKQVKEYIIQEINNNINIEEDIDAWIIQAVSDKIKKSLDSTMKHYRNEYETFIGEMVMLRRTKDQSERELRDLALQIEDAQNEITKMKDHMEVIQTMGKDIYEIGEFAQALQVTLATMTNITGETL